MNELSFYLLESAVGITTLYVFYWLFLRQETFFSLNRFYLLLCLVLSFVFPLLNFSFGMEVKGYFTAGLLAPVTVTGYAPESDYAAIDTLDVVQMIYLAGAVFFLSGFFWQLLCLALQYYKSPKICYQGFTVVITKTTKSPASFFGVLFIAEDDWQGSYLDTIVSHENYHRLQFHSLDIIFAELLTVIQWFNPFIWLYKNALRAQHEYAADRNMIIQGEDKLKYQSLLFEKGVGLSVSDLMSYFNDSLLKTRMKMMNKQQSKPWTGLKYLLTLPLFALLSIGLFSEQNLYAQQNSIPDEQVDQLPKYPGGDRAMYYFLKKNIKYPKSARIDKAQGKVFVSFVVDKTGKVTDVKASERNSGQKLLEEMVVVGFMGEADTFSDNPTLNMEPIITEAKYVVSQLAQFTPGKKDGKNVAVKMTIPITFKLN